MLPKYLLEGATDYRDADAAKFTRVSEEVDLLERTMTVPKKLPDRWAVQLGFEPSALPEGWGYMFRTADFHRAQYFNTLRSALLVMLRPHLLDLS